MVGASYTEEWAESLSREVDRERADSVATKGGAAIHAIDRAGEAPVVPRFKFSL